MSDTVNQATESAPEKRPLRVLVVEDSEFDARMLVGLLRAGGFEPEFERWRPPVRCGRRLAKCRGRQNRAR